VFKATVINVSQLFHGGQFYLLLYGEEFKNIG